MNNKTATAILSAGVLVSAAIGVLAITTTANSQSFSCALADTPAEFAVCNSENLLIKDEHLAALFRNAIGQANGTENVQKVSVEQSLWMKRRNDCQNNMACIDRLYDERIRSLDENDL